MKPVNRATSILITVILIAFSINCVAGAEGRPRCSEHVSYSCPDWISDTELVYVKDITYFKYHYDWLSDIAKGSKSIEREEHQICAYNNFDNSERVIKSIKINYKKSRGRTKVWEDEVFQNVAERITALFANDKKRIIVFSTECWDRKLIFTMNYDGTNIKKLLDYGYNHRISPDGTKVLFNDQSGIMKYIDLESHEIYPIISNAARGIWDATGRKVIYETNEKTIRNRKIMVYDLHENNLPFIFTQSVIPDACSPDGSKTICGRLMFDMDGKDLEVENIPNNARFSPDGNHLTGDPVDVFGDVCILNSDGTEFKVLKTSYIYDHD